MGKAHGLDLAERTEEVNRARVLFAHGVSGVPVSAHRDLDLAVAIDVTGGNADIVAELGALLSLVKGVEELLFPGGILVPPEVAPVREKDVLVSVTVHVAHRKAVADDDVGIDGLGFEIGLGCVESPRKTSGDANGDAVTTQERRKDGAFEVHG